MPHTAGGALVGMQLFNYPVIIDIPNHILCLLARIIHRLFAGGAHRTYRLKMG